MTQSLYIATMAPQSGKSLISLGVMELLSRQIERVGFFRPVIRAAAIRDNDIALMRKHFCPEQPYEDSYAATHAEARQMLADGDQKVLLNRIFSRYRRLAGRCEFVLCEGTDFAGLDTAFAFDFNAQVAGQLGCPVLIVANGRNKITAEVVNNALAARETYADEGCAIAATIVNRVDPEVYSQTAEELQQKWPHQDPVYVLPEHATLGKPTLEEVATQLGARTLQGDSDWLKQDVMGTKIAAMHLANFLDHVREGSLVITPGDRSDIILGSLACSYSERYPTIAGIILTGGLQPAPQVAKLVAGLRRVAIPIFSVAEDTYDTAMRASSVRSVITPDNERKIAAALGVFESHIDVDGLQERIAACPLESDHSADVRA